MKTYTVLHLEDAADEDGTTLAFVCEAEDEDHAQEQCENAYPNGEVLWTVATEVVGEAWLDYYCYGGLE